MPVTTTKQFSLATEEDAERARAAVESAQLSLTTIKETISRKQPRRPLTTSTLQQLASSRLGMSATETMAVKQARMMYNFMMITEMYPWKEPVIICMMYNKDYNLTD